MLRLNFMLKKRIEIVLNLTHGVMHKKKTLDLSGLACCACICSTTMDGSKPNAKAKMQDGQA